MAGPSGEKEAALTVASQRRRAFPFQRIGDIRADN
jgi:hypothetical protein